MAGKTTRMSKVKQLITLNEQGRSIKSIAKILGISRNTVKSYLEKLSVMKIDTENIRSMDDIQAEGLFHSGNPSYKPDKRYEDLMSEMDYYSGELKRKGVTRELLHEEYKSKHPNGYGYSQFCYHLQQRLIASKPTMVLHHEPGDKLMIDFCGDKLSYVDRDTGEIIPCEVFVGSLAASDYCFAMAVPSQKTPDFLHALESCLIALGGVPKSIVSDNLKSAVIKTSKYEPQLNQLMEEFANHYGTTVVPARAFKPRDKALVENQVNNVYRRVFAPLRNQQFFDIASLNESITREVHRHNQTRMQLKEYCREEYFMAEEKHRLAPLPSMRFEIVHYADYKVAQNGHVMLSEDKHYYSVPYKYIGQKVKVAYTRDKVRIYSSSEQVAIHQRGLKKGGYTTEENHLCSAHKHYLERSPDYYMNQARKMSENLYLYVQGIFNQKRHPEQLYRQCDGLLSLARKAGKDVLDKSCSLAMEQQVYSYTIVRNIIENKTYLDKTTACEDGRLPEHANIRGKKQYQ